MGMESKRDSKAFMFCKGVPLQEMRDREPAFEVEDPGAKANPEAAPLFLIEKVPTPRIESKLYHVSVCFFI